MKKMNVLTSGQFEPICLSAHAVTAKAPDGMVLWKLWMGYGLY